jgi:predicted nuclease with TOPRIM domain
MCYNFDCTVCFFPAGPSNKEALQKSLEDAVAETVKRRQEIQVALIKLEPKLMKLKIENDDLQREFNDLLEQTMKWNRSLSNLVERERFEAAKAADDAAAVAAAAFAVDPKLTEAHM